jgi:TonB family protein
VQSTRHDPAIAALRASTRLPGHVVDVVVLSGDAGFLATMQEAGSSEHAIWPAPSADAAVDLLVGGRCGVLIADLSTLRGSSVSLLEQLHTQFPELVLLATGRREEEHAVAALVTSGRIYRFLHKPVSPARAGLFLGAATRRYGELRNLAMPAGASASAVGVIRWLKLAAGVLVIAVVLAISIALWPDADEQVTQTVSAPTDAANKAHDVADLLGHAQMAYAANRLSEPRGSNALQYFRAALALDPRNADAQDGIDRVLTTLEARVVQALEERSAIRGANALTALQRAVPDHPRVESLRGELLAISRARPVDVSAPAVVHAPRTVAATVTPAAPHVATPNLDLARARIAAGALTEPDDDSALTYLRKAQEGNESESSLKIVATDAGSKALDLADAAIAAGDEAQARRWLASAQLLDREFEVTLPGVEQAAQRLTELGARSGADRELTAAIRMRERGQLIAPAGNNAYESMLALSARGMDTNAYRTERQRLASTMLEQTHTALAANDLDTAQALLRSASTLVPGMSAEIALERELANARDVRDFAKNIVPATSLNLTRSVPPRYPAASQREGVAGYVDLEFTVAADGTTQDFIVKRAQPAGVFDKAAIDAVRQWRFGPVIRNGAAVPQRAYVRVRFELK